LSAFRRYVRYGDNFARFQFPVFLQVIIAQMSDADHADFYFLLLHVL